MSIIKLKVENFRKIQNPYFLNDKLKNNIENLESETSFDESVKYIFHTTIEEIQNVKEWGNWFDTNPREQKLTSAVPKKIFNSLNDENDFNFHNWNRGILFSATNVTYDNRIKEVSFEFNDSEIHGNIDGGHTLRIIINNKTLKNSEININNKFAKMKFVTIEIYEDLSTTNLLFLAETRNTSTQVKDQSLENLKGSFNVLKEILKDEPYKNDVLYMENEVNKETGKNKTIDIREIISLINMFDWKIFPSGKSMVTSYSSKSKSINEFLEIYKDNDELLLERKKVIIDVIKLYDLIQQDLNNKALQAKKIYKSKPFAQKKTSNNKTKTKQVFITMFSKTTTDFNVPKGLIYPLLASFKTLLNEDNNSWKVDPFDAWEDIGYKLVEHTLNALSQLSNNPQTFGKTNNSWTNLENIVKIYLLETKVDKINNG